MDLNELKQQALQNNIPIITDETKIILQDVLAKLSPKEILEIGTAIGYSAAVMACTLPDSNITTVEIDSVRYEIAIDNLKSLNLYGRITLINDDAASMLGQYVLENRFFDFVFLDGPKGQYINYIGSIKKILKKGGILFCDNISFHGYSKKASSVKKKMRTIAVNLADFEKQLRNDKDFLTDIIGSGDDCIAVCIKK